MSQWEQNAFEMSTPRLEEAARLGRRSAVAPPKQSTSSPNLESAARPPPMLKQLLVNHRPQLRSMTRSLQLNHSPCSSPPGDGRTGLDVGVQKDETKKELPRRRSSLLNEDFRGVAGRRRSSVAYHVESFENLIDWANTGRPRNHETSCSHDGKPVPASSEEPGVSAGPTFLGENAPPPLLRIPTVGNMTSGFGTSKKTLMVLDPHAAFPESLLLKATLDERNNFPEAHLPCLLGQGQSPPNSAPDQSSQKPNLLHEDATTTKATTTEAAATDMGLLHVRQNSGKARRGLTSHFHNTVSTYKDTLLAHSPQINSVIKRIILAQAAYANSSDESSPLRRLSRSGSGGSARKISAENIPTRPHIIPLSVIAAAENISAWEVTLPHIIPLSDRDIQTEDSTDRISEGDEDCISEGEEHCIIDDGTDSTEEHHTSRMGNRWLVSGPFNSRSNVHVRSFKNLPSDQRGAVHTKKPGVRRSSSS